MAKFLTAIPDPDSGWTLFSGKRAVRDGRDLHEAVGNKGAILVGVPVAKSPTFFISVPTTDSSLLRPMAYAQIEKRGLGAGSADKTIFDFDVIEQQNGHTKIAVHLIDTPLPDDYILPAAAGYAPSALVRERIDNGGVLWKENRQLVFAIFTGGRLIHSQVLTGNPEISVSTAQEINLLLLSLQGDPAFEESLPEKLAVVIDGVDESDKTVFSTAVNLEAKFTDAPGVHRKAHPRPKLTPHAVLDYRRRKKTVRIVALCSVVALAAYFVVGVFMWKKSEAHKRKIAALSQQIALIEPDVEEIQRIEARWNQMEPAFDLKWFPVVQLSRITEALPGSGVVIREFKTRERNIYIEGQARDVQLAFRLEEDLSNLPGFEHYEWSMPKPNMNSDNTASFKIEGKPIEIQ
ncbi:MAG: hypothetical protein P1U89_16205 [Verrucomicrobiales bacterium]|nr:hypothetical protein [Verrucomicrobiales bacterium]